MGEEETSVGQEAAVGADKAYGDFAEIEHLISVDSLVEITSDKPFEEPDSFKYIDLHERDDKKSIEVRSLFGSHKSCGFLPSKRASLRKKQFSYQRIFGHDGPTNKKSASYVNS